MGTVTTRELTCIGCPMGCPLIVTMEAGEVISVTAVSYTHLDVYKRQHLLEGFRIWNAVQMAERPGQIIRRTSDLKER